MSIVSQNNTNEVALVDCIQRFFSKHQVGKLLKKCNGTKEKGVPAITLLRYKLGYLCWQKHVYAEENPIPAKIVCVRNLSRVCRRY